MKNKLVASAEIKINKPVSKVWDALTNPEQIKKYFFGTNAISDWKVGSPLEFKGEWEGKEYHDKGVILKSEKDKLFQYTYLSSMSGKEDKPENYATVTYELSSKDGQTNLKILQDGNESEESKKNHEENWNYILKSIKDLLEKD